LKREDVPTWTPLERLDLVGWVETDEVDDKAKLLVILHFVDVDSVTLGLQSVLSFSLDSLLLSQGVDGNFPVVRLPVNASELQNFALHLDLLVGYHIALLNVK